MLSPETNSGVGIPPIAEIIEPRDHCGLWAAWDPDNPHLIDNALVGLQGIEHRGEDGAGIVLVSQSNDGMPAVHGDTKVSDFLFNKADQIAALPRDSYAITTHSRYSTHESDQVQPIKRAGFALAHNGNVFNTDQLVRDFGIEHHTTDSDVIASAIDIAATKLFDGDVEAATQHVMPHLKGAFCLTILTPDKLIAVRDQNGVRPLQLGTTETGGYVVSSEVKAINDIEGMVQQREIQPGEMVVISDNGVEAWQWAKPKPAVCSLEVMYLSNKENVINGQKVEVMRRRIGARLAKYTTSGIIVPLPNSGNQVAHGIADASGLPYVSAFTKVEGFGRSFLQPDDEQRLELARRKLTLDEDMVKGKDVWLADDTLVRGNTLLVNVEKVWKAGAKSVHILIGAPQITKPCRLGVDTRTSSELLAVKMGGNVQAMCDWLGANTLTFLTKEDIGAVAGAICDSCLGGSEPDLSSQALGHPLSPQHRRQFSLMPV